MDLKQRNSNFRLEHCPEKQDFSDVPLLPKIIRWNDPNSPITFTFQQDFSGNVFQMVNNQYQSRKTVNK